MARRQDDNGSSSIANIESVANKAVLLDALPGCIFLIGPDHTVLAANASVQSMLGSEVSKVIGNSLQTVMATLVDSEGDPLDVDTSVDRCLSTGEAELLEAWLKPGYTNNVPADKDLNTISVTILPVSTPGHVNQAAVVVGGEVVRQPYALRDAVLSMVSHELRTPLLHIKGFISTLLESDIEWGEETRLDFLHTIDREADRLTSMVNDLMEITRMGSVDLPLHLEDADPYLLAFAAIDSASPFISKHRVLVEVPEDLPKIKMDVLRVMGVLANLLQNASKYSKPGSRIIINAKTDQSAVTFCVSDEGSGIPADAGDRIFSMFFRGTNAAKGSSGSGLGLAVCKSVVDAHGGKIWVESEEGKGSTFKFTIPFNLAKPSPPTHAVKIAGDKKSADNVASSKANDRGSTKAGVVKRGKKAGVTTRAKRNRRVAVVR